MCIIGSNVSKINIVVRLCKSKLCIYLEKMLLIFIPILKDLLRKTFHTHELAQCT